MKRIGYFVVLLALFLSGCVVINLPRVEPLVEKTIGGEGADKVLMLEISGVMTDERDDRGFAVFGNDANLTGRMREALDKAAEDDRVRALLLRINSPGGSVTTCDIIAHELAAFKEKRNIPVVAELMDVAASGGYYVASVADEIIAHPTTVTGSIGVIALNFDASGLMEKVGLDARAIKSGKMKDMGSPLRGMTDEELAVFQSIIDSMYGRFLDVVMSGRGDRLTREKLEKLADGRIYSADQALDAGLIDRIGYLDDAEKRARELAGLDEATIVTYAPTAAYRDNIYSAGAPARGMDAMLPGGGPSTINLVNIGTSRIPAAPGVNFMYLWLP